MGAACAPGGPGCLPGWGGGMPPPSGALTLAPPLPQVGTIPERLGWSGVPSPQGAELRAGRSPRPGGCSPASRPRHERGSGEGRGTPAVLMSSQPLLLTSQRGGGGSVRPTGRWRPLLLSDLGHASSGARWSVAVRVQSMTKCTRCLQTHACLAAIGLGSPGLHSGHDRACPVPS